MLTIKLLELLAIFHPEDRMTLPQNKQMSVFIGSNRDLTDSLNKLTELGYTYTNLADTVIIIDIPDDNDHSI
jgi:hypothetical protein